ncbi:MAG: P1 family peptidase [Eubacteriales bacterium]|nr:P1 family peptidase [Eubacteriales bacterium]
MAGFLTGITGLKVGHYTDKDALTGCTAVLCEGGAVAGVDVRGCAPGTRETDLLRGYNLVERVHAVMLCGGSAYGLDAASGAMQYLEEKGVGFVIGVGVVPIVPAAVIFDLGVGDYKVRPGKQEGYAACATAQSGAFETGSAGAGTGATVAKLYGPMFAAKGGLGTCCIDLFGGVKVAAIAVVNALGEIYDPDTGKLVAGANAGGRPLTDAEKMQAMAAAAGNTTIGVVATNAALTREEANKLAAIAHDGLALTIRPVHTPYDGDTFFGLSTLEIPGVPFAAVLTAAVRAVTGAVLSAVGIDK